MSDLRFYLDASIQIGLSRALALVRRDILYPGMPGCPVTSPDVDDADWLAIAGAEQWVVIMRDKRVKHRPRERAALKENRVRAFTLTAAGNLTKWDTLRLLVSKWDVIAEIAQSDQAPPYLYAITQGAPRLIEI